jgi:hypothetical protein
MGTLRARQGHPLAAARQENMGRRAPDVGPAVGLEGQEPGGRDTVAARGPCECRYESSAVGGAFC